MNQIYVKIPIGIFDNRPVIYRRYRKTFQEEYIEFYNPSEAVKKLISSTFVPKGQVDFQSFRMRSLRLRVTRHGNKDICLSELTTQCFDL